MSCLVFDEVVQHPRFMMIRCKFTSLTRTNGQHIAFLNLLLVILVQIPETIPIWSRCSSKRFWSSIVCIPSRRKCGAWRCHHVGVIVLQCGIDSFPCIQVNKVMTFINFDVHAGATSTQLLSKGGQSIQRSGRTTEQIQKPPIICRSIIHRSWINRRPYITIEFRNCR